MRCPHCGCETHSGRVFCPNCEKRLVPLEDVQRRQDDRGRGIRRVIALVVAAALVIGGLGCFLAFRQKPASPRRMGGIGWASPTPTAEPDPVRTAGLPDPTPDQPESTQSVSAQSDSGQPVKRIISKDDLYRVMRWVIAGGERRVEDVMIAEADISAVMDDFNYYVSSYQWQSSAVGGPITLTFELQPSRRAWYAFKSGAEAGLDSEAAAVLRQARDVVSSLIRTGMTDWEKELALHDYIINHCDYTIDVEGRHTADIRGFFNHGACQCSGYADTFWLLGSMAGLEVEIITGRSTKPQDDLASYFAEAGDGHAWNLVRLDGQWYGLDVTWDDPVGERMLLYNYFNVPVSILGLERTWDRRMDPDGVFAQALDDNYYLIRTYGRPEYLAHSASEAVRLAIPQIDAGGEAFIAFTNKTPGEAEQAEVGTQLAGHYGKTAWRLPLLDSTHPFARYMPFILYKFYFE